MFRTQRAIVHRDRMFSKPLTWRRAQRTHTRYAHVYRRVSFRVAFSLITSRLKSFDSFGRTCLRVSSREQVIFQIPVCTEWNNTPILAALRRVTLRRNCAGYHICEIKNSFHRNRKHDLNVKLILSKSQDRFIVIYYRKIDLKMLMKQKMCYLLFHANRGIIFTISSRRIIKMCADHLIITQEHNTVYKRSAVVH